MQSRVNFLSDVTAPNGENFGGLRSTAVFVQGREAQGVHGQGRYMASAWRLQVRLHTPPETK